MKNFRFRFRVESENHITESENEKIFQAPNIGLALKDMNEHCDNFNGMVGRDVVTVIAVWEVTREVL